MQTLSEMKELLAEHGIRPKHRYGQNFLHDQNQVRRLIEASGVGAGDLVLEIGPGTGTLTETLIERGVQVIACEIDPDMAAIVEDRLSDAIARDQLRVFVGDCLASKHALNTQLLDVLSGRSFRLVANLPYSITSPLIGTVIENHWRSEEELDGCEGMYVTVQKEAADRILGPCGTKEYGPLSVLVNLFTKARKIATVPASCFWPEPKVTSAMVAIEPVDDDVKIHDLNAIDRRAFAAFLLRLFQSRRKQLGRILGRHVVLPDGIDAMQRPESLTPRELVVLFRSVGERT